MSTRATKVNFIDLEKAASELLRCSKDVGGNDRRTHFLLVGAGVSYPSIPLAGDIIDECKKKALKDGTKDIAPPKGMDEYSFWFEAAYPQAADRKEIILGYTKGKEISHANIHIAMMIQSLQPFNLVVTPNFDDQIARALRLFGDDLITCDHPATSIKIDVKKDVPQILHVHGSTDHYDICNLSSELKRRAKANKNSTLNILSTLDRILENHSPIVIGYSGWEKDVLMQSLKRRLEGRSLPYNLYWFLHREEGIKSLPKWLIEHPNTKFIIANGSTKTGNAEDEEDEPITLPAIEILEKFRKVFDIDVPNLMKDPIKFYIERLNDTFSFDDSEQDSELFAYVKNAQNQLDQAKQGVQTASFYEIIEDFRNTDYKGMLTKVEKHNWENENSNKGLICAFLNAGAKNSPDFHEAIKMIEKAISLSDHNEKFIITKLSILSVNNKDEFLKRIDEFSKPSISKKYDSLESKEMRQEYAKYLYYQAIELKKTKQFDKSLAILKEIIKVNDINDYKIGSIKIRSFNQIVIILRYQSKDLDEAIQIVDQLYQFAEDHPPTGIFRRYITSNLIRKAKILEEQGKIDKAEDVYQRLINDFQSSSDAKQLEHVEKAREEIISLQSPNSDREIDNTLEENLEVDGEVGEDED